MSRMIVISYFALVIACTTGNAQAQTKTESPVKIGILTDMSGLYSDISGPGSVVAAKMAADEFGGKILGQQIEFVQADHQNKPDVGSALAARWFDVEKVDVIADLATSSVALAVQEVARTRKRISIVATAGVSDLTGKACSPYGFHWTWDSFAQSKTLGKAVTEAGGNTWYLLSVDYAFGHTAQKEVTRFVEEAGGKVVGVVRHPLGSPDFSSFVLQAQASKSKVVALLNAGEDTVNSVKTAQEFGLVAAGQQLVAVVAFITDVRSLGLQAAKGLTIAEAFYWDRNDETREWSKRFSDIRKAMPTSVQAGVYSSVRHYLRAVEAAGTKDPDAVSAKMRELPVDDMFSRGGKVRDDGRMVHDMYLFQVKTPDESKYPWDFYKLLRTIPGDEAFRPLSESDCPLVTKANAGK
jgi:branched-chain amino acid transport system substrate-binding protein